MGCHFLLEGTFLSQGSNLGLLYLLHWQVGSWLSEPPGKPKKFENCCLWWWNRGKGTVSSNKFHRSIRLFKLDITLIKEKQNKSYIFYIGYLNGRIYEVSFSHNHLYLEVIFFRNHNKQLSWTWGLWGSLVNCEMTPLHQQIGQILISSMSLVWVHLGMAALSHAIRW